MQVKIFKIQPNADYLEKEINSFLAGLYGIVVDVKYHAEERPFKQGKTLLFKTQYSALIMYESMNQEIAKTTPPPNLQPQINKKGGIRRQSGGLREKKGKNI